MLIPSVIMASLKEDLKKIADGYNCTLSEDIIHHESKKMLSTLEDNEIYVLNFSIKLRGFNYSSQTGFHLPSYSSENRHSRDRHFKS